MPSVLSSFAVPASATGLRCPLSFFATVVVGPSVPRCCDVFLLAALGTSRQQNHEPVAVLGEIDPEFPDPGPDALDVGKVAKFDARERDRDLRGGLSMQALKPGPVRTVSICIEVFKNLHW